jgi:hypothetical protein
MTLYKTLKKGLKSENGNTKWTLKRWKKVKGKLEMCSNGFHCSKNILDAIFYVSPEIIAEVEVRGKNLKREDKQCWEEMRIIRKWNWTKKDSVALAIYVAELVLDNFESKYPNDKRPREAIEAAKKVFQKNTKKSRSAADSATWAAAKSATWAVAWAADSAAESTKQQIEDWIKRRKKHCIDFKTKTKPWKKNKY